MNIGQIIGGGKLELDLPTLVDTRLLIQANSGGGKSWLLRLVVAAEANNVIIGRTWLDADQARLVCPKPTGSSCVTWARVSFTPSAGRWVSRESCTSARTRSALLIRAPASVIFSRHRRHRGRFEECWPSLPTCRMRWKRKSEASMRRVGGSPSRSAKSNT